MTRNGTLYHDKVLLSFDFDNFHVTDSNALVAVMSCHLNAFENPGGLGALTDGLPGFAQALAGLFLGLLCYLPFYAAGVFGAGDAKAMMALGALLGPFGTIGVAVRSLIVAALLGLAWLIWRRELRSFAERWSMIVATTLANRKLNYFPPSEGSAAQTGIPFAVALVLGLAWAWIS